MKINFSTPLRDFDGKVIKDGEKTLTVKHIVNRSLIGAMPQQPGTGLTPAEAVEAFEIATRITHTTTDATDVTPAEIVLIDKAISMCTWAPLIYAQVKKIMDGEATGLETMSKTED